MKIYLGRHKTNGETYLYKHEWTCKWYWALGYVGNSRVHWHIDAIIKYPDKYIENWTQVGKHFEKTWITQDQWWILRDLFLTAYALQKAAETYGGHQTHQTEQANLYQVLDKDMAKRINSDLEKILDTIWELVSQWEEEQSRSKWICGTPRCAVSRM